MTELLTNPKMLLIDLFAILAIGSLIGHFKIRGLSLGTAGVLFVALVMGHYGATVPEEIRDLGLLLFVYAVGLQAGPRFFRTFKRRGIQFVVIGLSTLVVGLVVTIAVGKFLGLPYELCSGLFCGALTNTPALAAATETARNLGSPNTSYIAAGYGIAYPYSMIGVVLLIQFMPRLLGPRMAREEARRQEAKAADPNRLKAKQYRITNPACCGLTVREVNPGRMSQSNMSRLRRNGEVMVISPDTVLQLDDVVTVVGTPDELQKMRLVLGEEVVVPMDVNTNVTFAEVELTEDRMVGKSVSDLALWESHGVVLTRVKRQDLEFAPAGDTTLEFGDTVRVVGNKENVDGFVMVAGAGRHKVDETNMVSFLIGLVIGIAVGLIPFRFGGMNVKLGASGGAFVVSLLLGHFGRIGPFRMQVPAAAKNISRELGLMLFLAGAGTSAGKVFMEVFRNYGWNMIGAGAVITTVSVVFALAMTLWVYKMSVFSSMGALSACMTNPPALSASAAQTETDIPTLAYASVYPVALIFKVILAQLLVEILYRLL